VGLTYAVAAEVSGSARADVAPSADPAVVDAPSLPVHVNHTDLRWGQALDVSGRAAGGRAGDPVEMLYRFQAGPWSVVGKGVTGSGGRFRLRTRLQRSGQIRVIAAPGTGTAITASTLDTPLSGVTPGGQRVNIAGHLIPSFRDLNVLEGQRATVTGDLQPAIGGRRVNLQVRGSRGWRTIGRTRTNRSGGFRMRYRSDGLGSHLVRLDFSGDSVNAYAHRVLGWLNTYHPAVASYYDLDGTTACGEQLNGGTLGVANLSLPCGTMVTLRYDGRSVRVPVIDRGPYVGGREYDLTVATKEALGFGDLGTLWATA
jgi:hypothetical protein